MLHRLGPRSLPLTLCLAVLSSFAMVMAACAGAPDGWSVQVEGSGVGALVLRYTSDAGTATYATTDDGTETAILEAGPGDPEPGAAVAVLDPVSCRVISTIAPLPARHTYVAFGFGGSLYGASPYDPTDFGDPLDPAVRLAPTDRCATSDPAATPAPPPELAEGSWLNGWETYCEGAPNNGMVFGVRGEFLTGAVRGCRVEEVASSTSDTGVHTTNPGNDTSTLRVEWTAPGCSDGATVSILPALTHYAVHVIATSPSCSDESPTRFAATFLLASPVDASTVETSIDLVTE